MEGTVEKKSEMQKAMLTCEEATYYISMQQDLKLSFKKRISLKIHLLFCKYCKTFEKEIEFISDKIKEFTKRKPDTSFSKKLSEKKKQNLQKIIEEKL